VRGAQDYDFFKILVSLSQAAATTSVARRYILKTKLPIWVNFGASCNERYWYILRTILLPFGILYILPFRIFYGHLVYCVVIWHILLSLGDFFPVLVCCTKENLATLATSAAAAAAAPRQAIAKNKSCLDNGSCNSPKVDKAR
jgi:hypothetical protein